jgi:capsular polysaccharide biosynthesis protein
MLSEKGFQSVVLEDLSPQEQIETLYDADVVVGTHGAGLSNILFSPAGLRVIEIFPTPYVVPHYFFLSKALGHDYTYQCGDDLLNGRTYEVNVEELGRSLARLGIA